MPLVLIGAAILWFGWFGFNAGSTTMRSTTSAGLIFVNTLVAPAAAMLGWIVVEQFKEGKADRCRRCLGHRCRSGRDHPGVRLPDAAAGRSCSA